MIQHSRIKIVVAQVHCLLRDALSDRLQRESGLEVCAVASSMDDAVAQIERYNPQVLLMNIALKSSAGLSSMKQLKRDHSGLSIVALSCDAEFEFACIRHVLRSGADAYVSVDDTVEDLFAAIYAVGHGKTYLSDRSRQRLQESSARYNQLVGLSARESEVFFLTGCGYSPQRIAVKMNRSVKTIESYRERIRKKMNLDTGADLQYAATHFMHGAVRSGVSGSDEDMVRELLAATG